MLQAKFSLRESQERFLGRYKEYGFKDKSSMLRAAIDQLFAANRTADRNWFCFVVSGMALS